MDYKSDAANSFMLFAISTFWADMLKYVLEIKQHSKYL